MRILLLIALLLIWPVTAWADNPADREQALQHSGFVDPSADIKNKIRVAILPFDTPKDQQDIVQYGAGTMDSLIEGLKTVPQFIMLDRGRIDRVIKEQAFSQTGLVDARTAVPIGKLLQAQILVSGSLQTAGSGESREVLLVANFVDVKTGEVKDTQKVQGALSNIFALQKQLAELFIRQQNVTVTAELQQRIDKVIKSTTNLTAYDLYLKGRTAYLQFTPAGYEEAIKAYNQAVQADPKYALAYVGLAEAWNFWGHEKERNGELYQSDYQQAYNASYKAIQLNPNLAAAHRAMGRASGYLGRGGREKAVRQALKLNPNDAETWYELWFASGNNEDPDNEYIVKALALNPDLASAQLDRGLALFNLKRHGEAMAVYRQALRVNPSNAEAHKKLGDVLYAIKQYDQAQAEYQQSLRLNPNDAGAHTNLGLILYARQQYDLAMAEDREALRLNPQSIIAHNNLGLILYALKQYEPAVNEFREALRVNPNYAEAEFNMAQAMSALRWYDQAIDAYRVTLSLKPDYIEAHFGLGNALEGQGRKEEAVQEFELYLKSAPDGDNVAAAREHIHGLTGK